MFPKNITPFGTNTTFGNTTTTSPFVNKNQLNTGFTPNPSTSTFGQPTTNTMFPSMQPSNLFQSTSTTNFNTGTTNQAGFGSGIFGQQPQPSTSGLFGNATFGQQNKPPFGFGSTATAPTLFGQQTQQPASSTLFQPNTATNLFGTNTAFGSQPQSGTVIKFSPVTGNDTMQKNGVAQTISTKHHCITCMKEYENKSFEELRFEDYSVNRKGPQGQTGFSTAAFGGAPGASMPTLFDNKSTFGTPANTFGQTTNSFGMNTSSASNVFGKPTGFGTTTTTANTFGFNTTPSTNLFGGGTNQQTKSFTPLFGQTNTPPQQTGFGTNVFGQTSNQNMGTNLFQKPQTTTTGFTTGQSGFTFNTQPATTQSSSLFQVSKPNTGFGLFNTSTSTSGFGPTTQQQTGFGTTFGKPITTSQFGQGTQQSTFGTNLGMQQPSLFGGNVNKPLFANNQTSTGLFSNNVFQQPTNTFSLQMNQQQQQPQQQQTMFPPEATDTMKNLPVLASDIFPDGPHTYGLEPILPEINNSGSPSTTNPTEIKNLLNYSKMQDSLINNKSKVKVHLPTKPKIDPSITKEFFDDIHSYRSTRRTLVIKVSNQKKDSSTIFANYKNPLLQEADRAINQDRKDVQDPPNLIGNMAEMEPLSAQNTTNKDETVYHSINESTDVKEKGQSNSNNEKGTQSVTTVKPTVSGIGLNEDISVNNNCDSTDSISNDGTIENKDDTKDDTIRNDNPAGVILTRPEYYMIPPIEDLHEYIEDNGDCIIQGFTVGRRGYGNVYFPDPINIKNLNLDEIVHFRHREIIIYPDDSKKPPIGEGLNRRAQVTLDKIYPREKGTNQYIKDVEKILESNFVENLMAVTQKHNCKFVDYRPETGSWVFKARHFSKYNFTDSDEEQCEISSELIALQTQRIADIRGDRRLDAGDATSVGLGGVSQTTQLSQQQQQQQQKQQQQQQQQIPETIDNTFDYWPEVSYSCDEEEFRKKAFTQVMKASLFYDQPPEALSPPKLEDIEPEFALECDILVTPQYHTLSYQLPPIRDELLTRCYADLGLFKRKAFKVGFSKGYHFLQYDEVNLEIKIAKAIAFWKMDTCDRDFSKMMPNIIDCLKITLEESELNFDNNEIPIYKIKEGRKYLEKQTLLFLKFAEDQQLSNGDLYLCAVWNLCMALWSHRTNNDVDKREYFSNWLTKFTYDLSDRPCFISKKPKTHDEALNTIFELLTYNRIDDAADLAFKFDMNYLALLIGQCGLTQIEKYILLNYVEHYAWVDNATPDLYKKVFMLIAGLPNSGDINIFQDIDWLRCLGMHLWYIAPSSAPIFYVVEQYKKAFDEDCYAIKPHPPYGNYSDSYDLLYEILKLFIYNNAYRLCHAIDPSTHTNNPMDYRLSWILYQLFQSLRIGLIDDNEKIHLHTSLATQLENSGHWDWAIFVLLYIKNTTLKKKLIMRILERNISPDTIEMEERLVKMFRLPSAWIHEVKGYQSIYTETPYETFQHFVCMKDMKLANRFLIHDIIPELFINDQYKDIEFFINKIALYQDEIYEWKNNAGLFKEYLEIQDQQINDDDKFGYEMRFRSICNRIKSYPRNTNEQRLCIAELSKKCAFLYRTLFTDNSDESFINNRFLEMYKQFIMPPDYSYCDLLYHVFKLIGNLHMD